MISKDKDNLKQLGLGTMRYNQMLTKGGNNMKVADGLTKDLVRKSFNKCDLFSEILVAITNDKIDKKAMSLNHHNFYTEYVRNDHISVGDCLDSLNKHVVYLESLVKYCNDKYKNELQEIQEIINSYITIIELSDYQLATNIWGNMSASGSHMKYTANNIISLKINNNNTNEKVELKWLKVRTKK